MFVREFSNLIEDKSIGKVIKAFEDTILESYYEDKTRVTGDETKRRFDICAKIFRELKGDLGWSLQRILDHLPTYLRNELDGVLYEPDSRKSWITSK